MFDYGSSSIEFHLLVLDGFYATEHYQQMKFPLKVSIRELQAILNILKTLLQRSYQSLSRLLINDMYPTRGQGARVMVAQPQLMLQYLFERMSQAPVPIQTILSFRVMVENVTLPNGIFSKLDCG